MCLTFSRTVPLMVVIVLLSIAATAQANVPGLDRERLAYRFQPHLFFDSLERWRPLEINAFLAERGHRACQSLRGPGPCPRFTDPAQLTLAIAHLDLRGTGPGDSAPPDINTCAKSRPMLLDCDLNHRSAIYSHVQRIAGRIAIDYWWFMRYNTIRFGNHEGDWEGVTVILDSRTQQISDVHFAAHSGVWRYRSDLLRYTDGRHVHVYIARGSHAAYPRPCRTTLICRQTNRLPETRFNGMYPWVGNDVGVCARRCVHLFGHSGNVPAWNAWRGRWGVRNSPPSPAFQGRYSNPLAARFSARRTF